MRYKIKLITYSLALVLLLGACDNRKPLSQQQAREVYTQFAEAASEEACWQDNYVLVIEQNALICLDGQLQTAKDGDMTEEQLSAALEQNREWLQQLIDTASADDLNCDGWYASGVGEVCDVTWEQTEVPIASTSLMLYSSGTIRITVTYASGAGYESAEIYLCVAQKDEKNIFSMHGISVE